MNSATINIDEIMQCGYIKAKFPLIDGKYLDENDSYKWCCSVKRPRVTANFVYIALGHKDLPNNDTAREYIKIVHRLGGHITRIDFCIDYLGLLDFDAFYELHDDGIPPHPSILKSATGKTVYLGKRSSARMLRVYDKRGEILSKERVDIGFDMTRIELEIKRNMIKRYVELFMAGKTVVILSDIQRLYGLHGFCEAHEPSRPTHNRDKGDNWWPLLYRYRRLIRRAYLDDIDEFLNILEVNDNE